MDATGTSKLVVARYHRESEGSQPPLDWPDYRSTARRAPSQFVPLHQTLTEVTGPLLGEALVRPEDADLTRQHDGERVNVNGGAIALGHPLGMSGARLVVSLVHELRRRGGRYGVATLCVGVGQGLATVVEAV